MSKFQVGQQVLYVGPPLGLIKDMPVTIAGTGSHALYIHIFQQCRGNYIVREEYLVPIKKFNEAPRLP